MLTDTIRYLIKNRKSDSISEISYSTRKSLSKVNEEVHFLESIHFVKLEDHPKGCRVIPTELFWKHSQSMVLLTNRGVM